MKFYILLIFSIFLGNIANAQPVIENPQITMDSENVLRATISFDTNKLKHLLFYTMMNIQLPFDLPKV